MTWLQFWASVIGSLAWPATAAFVVLLFRRQLLAVFPALTALELGSFKMKFEQELSAVGVKAAALQLPEPPRTPPSATGIEEGTAALAQLALVSPRAVVLEAWITVENELRAALKRAAVGVTRRGMRNQLEGLRQKVALSPILNEMILGLEEMRNAAAHHPDFALTPSQALDYAKRAQQASDALRTLAQG